MRWDDLSTTIRRSAAAGAMLRRTHSAVATSPDHAARTHLSPSRLTQDDPQKAQYRSLFQHVLSDRRLRRRGAGGRIGGKSTADGVALDRLLQHRDGSETV